MKISQNEKHYANANYIFSIIPFGAKVLYFRIQNLSRVGFILLIPISMCLQIRQRLCPLPLQEPMDENPVLEDTPTLTSKSLNNFAYGKQVRVAEERSWIVKEVFRLFSNFRGLRTISLYTYTR